MRATAELNALALLGAALAAACGEPAPAPVVVPDPPSPMVENRGPPQEPGTRPAPQSPPPPSYWGWEAAENELVTIDRLQSEDGSWGPDGDVATTGLALLAYLGCLETHNSGLHKDVVKAGLRYLVSVQDEQGAFADADVASDCVGTLAMTEAYGLTGSRLFKGPAERAVGHVVSRQEEDGGWGDVSTTVWATMVLKSARMSEIAVDADAFAAAGAHVRSLTDETTGGVRADAAHPRDDRPFPALTGDALDAGLFLARVFTGEDPGTEPVLQRAAARVLAAGRRRGTSDVDGRLLDWWFGSLATRQCDGAIWRPWITKLRRALDHRHRLAVETHAAPERDSRPAALRVLAFRSTQGYHPVFRGEKR